MQTVSQSCDEIVNAEAKGLRKFIRMNYIFRCTLLFGVRLSLEMPRKACHLPIFLELMIFVSAKQPNVFSLFLTDFVWSQEEHRNQGAWTFVSPRFENIIGVKVCAFLVARG